MSEAARGPIPMLEQRRIEAAILKHVYDTLKPSHCDFHYTLVDEPKAP